MIPAPTHTAPDAPPRVRDGFLDSVKVIALWRVVVWHALAWPWLSWFAAMPAMFYVAGLLLAESLERHGYRTTAWARLRRLLVPFWAFAAMAVATMVAAGWRPNPLDALWWVVPVGDPGGLDTTPGLWIPLWYIRAYLWVVIAGAGLAWLSRRFGIRVLLAPVAATLAVWAWQRTGASVPLAAADAALFPFFVLAGMLAAQGRLEIGPRVAGGLAAVTGAVAVIWYQFDPPLDGIVNASLPLHLLVGVASIGVLMSLRSPLSSPPPLLARFVGWSSRRALTIYLWHGLGLVVADRLVHSSDLAPGVAALAGLVVVVTVTVSAAVFVGPLEDVSAGRRPRRTGTGASLLAIPGAALAVVGLLAADADPDRVRRVPSGEALVVQAERAEIVDGSLAPRAVSAPALDEDALNVVFDEWTEVHADLLAELGTGHLDIAVVGDDGDLVVLQWQVDDEPVEIEPFPWFSMTKTATASWMVDLFSDGIVHPDETMGEYLDEVPYGDVITLDMLAAHSSGIPAEVDADFLAANPAEEIAAFVADPTLTSVPGEGAEYSRVGYHLLTWSLEEASGESWRSAMHDLAEGAGTTLFVDDEVYDRPDPTHPGDGDYRGAWWGAGGLVGSVAEGATFYRWLLIEHLPEDAVRSMGRIEPDLGWFAGRGLAPMCPCIEVDGHIESDRVGLTSGTGTYIVDMAQGVALMSHADEWWRPEGGPPEEFDDLFAALLDVAAA